MRLSRRMSPGAGWMLVGAVASGCAGDPLDPPAEWVVAVSTDAPVPQLGNRLLVEFLDDDGALDCPSCRRIFGVGQAESWPVTFGVARVSNAPLRVRARLFRSETAGGDGLPAGTALIDAMGRLP